MRVEPVARHLLLSLVQAGRCYQLRGNKIGTAEAIIAGSSGGRGLASDIRRLPGAGVRAEAASGKHAERVLVQRRRGNVAGNRASA